MLFGNRMQCLVIYRRQMVFSLCLHVVLTFVLYCFSSCILHTLEVVRFFFKVFKYLTITQNPKKTSIWHTLSEKKITSTSKPIIGTPLFFSQWPRLVQPAPKQIGGPMISLEVEVIFFSLNLCQMVVFIGFRVIDKYLITKKNSYDL